MKVVRKSLGVFLAIGLSIVLGLMLANQRALQDWWVLRDYEPTPRIVEIADKTAMNDEARHIFYVYDPKIEDSEVFNTHCTTKEVSIVLGCYNGSDIYIFNVEDEKLSGVQEVTAAHEMLHAAYDRLSETQRADVDRLTQKQFQKLADERIQTTVKAYRDRDASVVPNELHSILATEVRDLDPELEAYYSKYFTDRKKVVALSESYEQVFSDIKARVVRLDAELTLLKAQIDTVETDLSRRAEQINAESSSLDRLRGQQNTQEYNSRVPGYNESINSYNADLANYKNLINEYNIKVEVRNDTTVEQNNLIDSLSSNAQEL